MAGEIVQRSFAFSFTELISIARNLCVALTRDLSDLAVFGLISTNITNLSDLCDDFDEMRTDIEYEGDVMVKTEEKIILAEQVKDQIRFMNVRVEAAFGAGSIVYDTFHFGDLNLQPDKDLLETLRRITRMSNQYIANLGTFGVTAALISELETLATNFSNALIDQEESIDIRRLAANDRIIAANGIYRFVSTYSNFGKKFFAKSNPAKYQDYVIYTPGPGSLTAPTDLSFYFPGTLFSWSPVENAVSYILQASTDGVDFFEIFSGAETEFVYVPIQENFMWFRVLGHNAGGNGPWSTVLKNGYYPGPTLPAPSNLTVELVSGSTDSIKLNFDEVPSASKYKIYRSTANIGDVSGSFVYAGQSTDPVFIETLAAAHRYYYRCTCENQYQASGNSSEVWIEI